METYDLHPENNFLIEFDKIPEEQARRAKMMIVSYPLNPVCVTAPDSFYEEPVSYTHLDVYKRQVQLVSDVRNVYCYTGQYKGVTVSVMASGMGMPSIGIYSYELYKFYDVENICLLYTSCIP